MTADARPNTVIRGVREREFRMSRDEFARLVNATAAALSENTGCTSRLIAAWERGEVTTPRPVYARVLHEMTGRSLAELGFAVRLDSVSAGGEHPASRPPRPVDAGDRPGTHTAPVFVKEPDSCTLEDMIRREFLRLASVASVSIPGAPAGETTALDTVDTDDFREYGALNAHLWSVYSLAPAKQAIYPVVRDHVSGLTSALRDARSEEERRTLCDMLGNVAQLAGEVWFDANRYTEAAHCYALAGDASKEARNRDLWACGLVRHSFVSIYSRRYGDALPLLDAAEVLARNGDSQLPTRHWVASVRAQVLAGLGDADGCGRALDEATAVQATATAAPGGWLRFTGDRLAEERGAAYMSLGRLDLAEHALCEALQDSLSPRRRGAVLSDLAVIGARRRDIDRLVTYGSDAADLAQRTGSGYIVRRLHGLQPHLAPFLSDSRVTELRDRLITLGA
ncbi:transcriptional regulator [Streptomyces sp. NPDC020983]|uniref:transcriptional regulator n=1 Tax=Streptomyces sp. NPDC020983 TaxID=3365106 RepID=UPI00378DBA53